jgi:glycosyltransferase involved in cell wall biosynthesis
VLSPLLHRRALSETTVLRTFNITGAVPALLVRAYTGAPIFASYGYSLPDFVRFQHGRLKGCLYRLIEKVALARSDCILAATAAQTASLGARYGARRVVHLPNFVDPERFRPAPAVRADYLLFVGRLSRQKNLASLLEAVARADPTWPVKVVGHGEEEGRLRRLADSLRLRVEFSGVVPNDRLPEIYAAARAFVLPSRFEGMPKALLEAMACAAPCLGSDVEGIRDLIRDGETGLLAPPSVEGLADGLRRLADAGLRERIGQAARRFVLENYSMARVLAREIEILKGKRPCA